MTLTLLTGGARSGKSSIAVRRADRSGAPVVFVATGQAGDEEMADRIARHREERPESWETLEAPLDLAAAVAGLPPGRTVVVDCLSLWVSNLMGRGDDETAVIGQAGELAGWAAAYPGTVIVVTNEVGSGIVPMHPVSRDYRDRLGRVNALVAAQADLAQLVVAGRTLTLDPAEDRPMTEQTRREPPVVDPLELVEATVARIAPFDADASAAVAAAMDGKVKPLRSLGRLEHLAARLAGIQGTAAPHVDSPAVVVCAADHGVAADGVSAYPQEVTALMLQSFAEGTSAVGVLARQAGARLVVVDLGVKEPPSLRPGQNPVLDRRVRAGTADSATGPAMSVPEAQQAVAHGIGLVDDLVADGVDLVALGEMGIGSTTTASALTAALLDRDPARLVGPGTGVSGDALARKLRKVDEILARHRDADDTWEVLARVGGLEIAALAGVVLGCAAGRVPVLLDGFITTAAALVARRLAPGSVDAMVAGHLSPEPGHAVQLDALGLEPVLDLGMRLGEGSGAALAIPVLRSAVAVLRDMGSFADLGLAADLPTA